MKRLLFTFLLSLSFVLFIGIGRAYAEVNAVTPSTNDINRTNGQAHVDQLSQAVGSTDLQFISTRTFYSCFEYRTDGDTNQKTSDTNYNTNITDGLYPYFCQNNNSRIVSIPANEYVEIRMVFGAETDERFDWTRFDVLFERTAEIISPSEGEEVWGEVNFKAKLNDKENNDNVQWAVRKGTCDAGTGTKFGNVDGFHDPFEWDGQTFSASADTTLWELGNYCFVFNPTESTGDTSIRLTKEFKIINRDLDSDGILNDADLCKETSTTHDDYLSLGVNRWIWDGNSWETTKTKGTGPNFIPDMDYTYGCSCNQILTSMVLSTGESFEGHFKYGCSKSILEEWNSGRYYIGPTFLETIPVLASSSTPTQSIFSTEVGKDYFLKVSGSGMACNQPGCIISFDAEYSTSDLGVTWVNGVAAPYSGYGPNLLDLKVDGTFVNWGAYNSSHIYQIPYEGTGNPLSLLVYDIAGSYFNDSGTFSVDLIEDKWVDLW